MVAVFAVRIMAFLDIFVISSMVMSSSGVIVSFCLVYIIFFMGFATWNGND